MRSIRHAAAATLAMLVLSACGTSATDEPTPTPTPTATSAAPTSQPTDGPSPTDPSSPTATTRTVEVFFPRDGVGDPCEDVVGVSREVPAAAPLRGALESLLAGPTAAERADGYGGWFGDGTAGLLLGVRLDGVRALVSFDPNLPLMIPNASSACGSTALLAALDPTATQFPEVDEAWYDLAGDRAAFYGWLQYAAPDDEPIVVPPPSPEPTTAPTPPPSPKPTPTATPTATPLDAREWTTLPASAGRVVALTFDAGANADAVGPIMATLARTGTPGTFFLTGRWVTAYPQATAAIGDAHAVGNHSVTHPDLTTLDDAAVRDEVVGAQGMIAAAARDDPRPWFRFPYGARDSRTLDLVAGLGYRSVRWTVDTLGWQGTSGGQSATTVTDRVMASLQPGAIVLMHVGSHPTDGSTLDADALPGLIDRIRAAGYTFVDLDATSPS